MPQRSDTFRWDPEAMVAAIRDHDLLVRRVVAERGEGDSIFSVFTDAVGAVVTAVALQEALGGGDRASRIAGRAQRGLSYATKATSIPP